MFAQRIGVLEQIDNQKTELQVMFLKDTINANAVTETLADAKILCKNEGVVKTMSIPKHSDLVSRNLYPEYAAL